MESLESVESVSATHRVIPAVSSKLGVLGVLLMSEGTVMSYELSYIAAGMEEMGKSGDRIEGESASSISTVVRNQYVYLLLPH